MRWCQDTRGEGGGVPESVAAEGGRRPCPEPAGLDVTDGTGAGPQPATNSLAAARESGGGVRSCSAAGWENPLQSRLHPSPANAAEAGWRSRLGGSAFPMRVLVGLKVNLDAVCVCVCILIIWWCATPPIRAVLPGRLVQRSWWGT